MEADYIARNIMLQKNRMQNSIARDDDIKTYHDVLRLVVCAMLTQRGKLIGCVSKVMNKHQRKWFIVEKEFIAFFCMGIG